MLLILLFVTLKKLKGHNLRYFYHINALSSIEIFFFFPGQKLCRLSEENCNGNGTYVRNGYVYSSLAGYLCTQTVNDKVSSAAENEIFNSEPWLFLISFSLSAANGILQMTTFYAWVILYAAVVGNETLINISKEPTCFLGSFVINDKFTYWYDGKIMNIFYFHFFCIDLIEM